MAKKIRFSRTDVRGHTEALKQQGKSSRGGGFEPRQKKIFHTRMLGILVIFCFIVFVFTVHLIALQAAGNAFSVYEPQNVPVGVRDEIYVLQAPRGEIYDRNGNKLVTNTTSYSVVLDYNAFYSLGSVEARNRALLTLYEQCQAIIEQTPPFALTIPELAPELFPLSGQYPSLRFSDEATDPSSETHKALNDTLSFLGMPGSSASQIVQYYLTVYQLDDRIDGVPIFSDEEITTLIRLYYNMDRCAFAPGGTYLFATGMNGMAPPELTKLAIGGLRFFANSTRSHLYPGYASHLLGEIVVTSPSDQVTCNALGYFVNEVKGKSGCEQAFDSYLCGKNGSIRVTYDAGGNIVSYEILENAVPGHDVYLTVDIDLQIAAEDALRVNINTVENTGKPQGGADCDAGSVLATDPHTGEILAMASYPTYNNIIFLSRPENDQDATRYLNRVTSSLLSPAELFHLCSAVTALDRALIFESSVLTDTGVMSVGGVDVFCPLYQKFGVSHEQLGIRTALCDGCNVFFATLGRQMGFNNLKSYAASMGFGQSTGIELTELLGSVGDDYPADALFAVGQGGTVATPLQLCSALNTLLTGGDRFALRVFSECHSYISGAVLEQSKATTLSSLTLSAANCGLLRSAMQDAATANTILSGKTAGIRDGGVEVGCLGADSPAGTMSSQNALLLSYGSDGQRAISICVVLEHGGDAALASPTAAAVLNEYFSK